MQLLGERLGQAVGERLGHDRVVVVVVFLEARDELLDADARGDGEAADVIVTPVRRDEVGQREVLAGFVSCCWRSVWKRRCSPRDSSAYSSMSSPSRFAGQKP